jgi:hypothetical protein
MFLMVCMFALLAVSVDLGYLKVARTELQRSADAAALAGTWELIDEYALYGQEYPYLEYQARSKASEYAGLNSVTTQAPLVDQQQDVQVGYIANPFDPASPLVVGGPDPPNAVQVSVKKTGGVYGHVPLFFARFLGMDGSSLQAQATAALVNRVIGFRAPSSGENVDLLPFALDEYTWVNRATLGTDDWTYNPETGKLEPGGDGIPEVNLFPQDTGSPGNRGTVDIGSNNNSTADIARQIVDGVSPADLEYHGGEIKLDENGELFLNGDTGISAGVKDELVSIKGDPRTILIFREVQGPGNNATYTIVGFAGIRIMDVKLTGKMTSKRVTIQPAIEISNGAIPSSNGTVGGFVYSPVWLVR